MDGQGVYLYCLARAETLRGFTSPGMEPGEPVTTLEVRGLAAVISPVALDALTGPAGDANLADASWVVPRACAHERVVEEAMARSPVLPVRFGGVFSSRRALVSLVEAEGEAIAAFLDRLAGKEEWLVKGFVDTAQAIEWLLVREPDLAERRRGLPDAPGARYLAERQLRASAQARLKGACRDMAAQVQAEIGQHAAEWRALSLAGQAGSRDGAELVLRCAVLLCRDRLEEFSARLRAIESRHADKALGLRLSGPWPPYNFCPSLGGEAS